jgi:membrane protein required for colicin V production
MRAVSPVDVAALCVLGVAVLRGLAIGMVREAFSVAALAAACIAVRFGTGPSATWLEANALPELGPLGARILAGITVGLAAALLVGLLGRIVRRGVHAVGLGLADRLAGAAIGAAEGALVVAVVLLVALSVLGRTHPLLASSRTLGVFQRAEELARRERGALDVAAPPPRGAQRPEPPPRGRRGEP